MFDSSLTFIKQRIANENNSKYPQIRNDMRNYIQYFVQHEEIIINNNKILLFN